MFLGRIIQTTLKLMWTSGNCGTKSISRQSLQGSLKTVLLNHHCQYWDRIQGQSYIIYIDPLLLKRKNCQKFEVKRSQKTHDIGNRTLKIEDSSDSICKGCDEEDETHLHIISQCEAFSRLRIEMFGQEKLTQHDLKQILLKDIFRYHDRVGLPVE